MQHVAPISNSLNQGKGSYMDIRLHERWRNLICQLYFVIVLLIETDEYCSWLGNACVYYSVFFYLFVRVILLWTLKL